MLSSAGGAALLCGHAGVGRKSALALVAYMHHMEVSHVLTAVLVTNLLACRNHVELDNNRWDCSGDCGLQLTARQDCHAIVSEGLHQHMAAHFVLCAVC